MLPFKLVYSDEYYLPIGEHVFPAAKYRLIQQRLLQTGVAEPADFIIPQPASDEDILLVHTPMYVRKLKTGALSAREELELEVPYSPELVKAFWLMAGGSICAADHAIRDGACIHIGGGFHHAFPDHGEGFCLIHDVAVAIRLLQREGRMERALIVDCDVHQGNGTAKIFGNGEPEPFPPLPSWSASLIPAPEPTPTIKHSSPRDVFTVSLHQENNYPVWKPPSSIDVNLPDGVGDDDYLGWLDNALSAARRQFKPEMLFYLAGADPYKEDQLGGLALTIDGLKRRDRLVFEFAKANSLPVMVTYAGGYARKLEDTVTIHTNTVLAANEVLGPIVLRAKALR
jgi:acetoin utilization deacetylase AcuC-like enzyme